MDRAASQLIEAGQSRVGGHAYEGEGERVGCSTFFFHLTSILNHLNYGINMYG